MCDCSLDERNRAFEKSRWWNPWCVNGLCITGQEHGPCKNKPMGYQPLGDGTWCWDRYILSVWDILALAQHSWLCPCFSVVPEATHKASQGPLKVAVSSQKGPRRRRGSCWEERKRKVFPQHRVIDLPSSQVNDFFYYQPSP